MLRAFKYWFEKNQFTEKIAKSLNVEVEELVKKPKTN